MSDAGQVSQKRDVVTTRGRSGVLKMEEGAVSQGYVWCSKAAASPPEALRRNTPCSTYLD